MDGFLRSVPEEVPQSPGRNLGSPVYTKVENLGILQLYLLFSSAKLQQQPFRFVFFLIAKICFQGLAHRGVNRRYIL